jgi:pimeloyl-ACP methyl ester carboxylesterase
VTRIASVVLVHGAGSGPWVYDGWAEALPGVEVVAVDLHAGVDVARASHADYADAVVRAARAVTTPVALVGWSMGGLVVLHAAARVQPAGVALLEASPPAEVQGVRRDVEPIDGTFDPEAVYGPFPRGMRARPESARARAERKRGISVPSLPCPALVVDGDDFPADRGEALAALYGAERRSFPGLDHWALVRDPRVRAAVAEWLDHVPLSGQTGRT